MPIIGVGGSNPPCNIFYFLKIIIMTIHTNIIQTLLKQTFNQDIDVILWDWDGTPVHKFTVNGVTFDIFYQKDGTMDVTNNIHYMDINMNSINSTDDDMDKIITHMMVLKMFKFLNIFSKLQ